MAGGEKSIAARASVATIAASIGMLVFAASSTAGTRVVHATQDSGKHSLRHAIANAKDGDLIKVPAGHYVLRKGEIAIDRKLRIRGAGAGKTRIDGHRKSRIFDLGATASVHISKLKLGGGRAPSGGAVLNAGTLTLTSAVLAGNRAGQAGVGGAISNSGTLTIDRSLLRANRARTGGAIAAGFESPSVTGPVTITRSRLIGNKAINDGFGGAIAIEPIAQPANSGLFISRSTLAGNQARGTASATRAYGGAIAFQVVDNVGIDFPLEIASSTLSGNRAVPASGDMSFGGAIYFEPVLNVAAASGALDVTNSTFSGNRALGSGSLGGAIFESAVANSGSSSDKVFVDSTIAGNAAPEGFGGGIWFGSGAAVFDPVPAFTDSIVADNQAGMAGTSDCNAPAITMGHNLEGHQSCGFVAPGDFRDTPARLKTLADNGGPTKTRALKASSHAVNGGNPAACVPRDQRGVTRPQRGRCDIGAYELKP
jgi:hypothetical protein